MRSQRSTGSRTGRSARTPARTLPPRGDVPERGRPDRLKNWFTASGIVIAALGLVTPLWVAAQTARQSADTAAYTQRAEMYRGYLAAASAFDISAARFICLSSAKVQSPADTAAAFKDLTNAYSSLSATAWNIEFSAADVSNDLKGNLRKAKEKIAEEADQVYGDLSKGLADKMSPAAIDGEISTLQKDFATYARSDLDGTPLVEPTGSAGGTLGCPGK